MPTIETNTEPTPSAARPVSRADRGRGRRINRAVRALAGTLTISLACCAAAGAGGAARADEQPNQPRLSLVGYSLAQPGEHPHPRGPARPTPPSSTRGYWCDPTRSDRPGGIGVDNHTSTLDDLLEPIDHDWGDDRRLRRHAGRHHGRIGLDAGRGRSWPLDLGAMGIQVRVGDPALAEDTTGWASRPAWQPTSPPRCQVTPASQSRTNRDHQRWGCVLTDRDTTHPGGWGSITRHRRDTDTVDWPDHQSWPGDDDWWPAIGTTDRRGVSVPSLDIASQPEATNTGSANRHRCLVIWPGSDGMEVHPGRLSPLAPASR